MSSRFGGIGKWVRTRKSVDICDIGFLVLIFLFNQCVGLDFPGGFFLSVVERSFCPVWGFFLWWVVKVDHGFEASKVPL